MRRNVKRQEREREREALRKENTSRIHQPPSARPSQVVRPLLGLQGVEEGLDHVHAIATAAHFGAQVGQPGTATDLVEKVVCAHAKARRARAQRQIHPVRVHLHGMEDGAALVSRHHDHLLRCLSQRLATRRPRLLVLPLPDPHQPSPVSAHGQGVDGGDLAFRRLVDDALADQRACEQPSKVHSVQRSHLGLAFVRVQRDGLVVLVAHGPPGMVQDGVQDGEVVRVGQGKGRALGPSLGPFLGADPSLALLQCVQLLLGEVASSGHPQPWASP